MRRERTTKALLGLTIVPLLNAAPAGVRIIDGLVIVRERRGFRLYLHRFSCYLEVLLKHVGRRSVLSDLSLSAAA